MELRSYAVSKYLSSDNQLLDHLVKGSAIPIAVVEDAFGELIETLQDAQAEALTSNYKQYLADHVKVGLVTNGPNEFDVTGDIDDRVLQVIKLLHDVDQDKVVTDLITTTFEALRGDRELSIDHIAFSESVTELVTAIQENRTVTRKPQVIEEEVVSEETNPSKTITDLDAEVAAMMAEIHKLESSQATTVTTSHSNEVNPTEDAVSATVAVPIDGFDPSLLGVVDEDIDLSDEASDEDVTPTQTLPTFVIETEEGLDENNALADTDAEIPTEEEDVPTKEPAIQRIYNHLINGIRDHNMPERFAKYGHTLHGF